MIKAKGLKVGDRLGLIAPSSPAEKEKIDRSKRFFEGLGFEVELGKAAYNTYGYLAGRDEERARDINNMFSDKDIDGIICLRGGYGSSRLLELIDFNNIRNNPKVFVGFSDITALHIAINKLSNLITFHGPMAVSNFSDEVDRVTLDNFKNILFSGDFDRNLKNPLGEEVTIINRGIVEGKVIGGNLSLIVNTIGSKYEIDSDGKILLIEEVGEDPYAIDRMLTQLKLAGKFNGVKGIILGDFSDCVASKKEYEEQLPLIKVFEDIIKPLGVPTIYNIQLGHCEPVLTLPLGSEVRLNGEEGFIELLEKPII